MIRPIHLRMARAALNWTLADLERKSEVGRNTISRYEAGKDILASSVERLENVLKEQGLVFFEGDPTFGMGIGLIGLKKQSRSRARDG